MSRYHNTLFVTSQGAYLGKEGENLQVRLEEGERRDVPIHHLSGYTIDIDEVLAPFG